MCFSHWPSFGRIVRAEMGTAAFLSCQRPRAMISASQSRLSSSDDVQDLEVKGPRACGSTPRVLVLRRRPPARRPEPAPFPADRCPAYRRKAAAIHRGFGSEGCRADGHTCAPDRGSADSSSRSRTASIGSKGGPLRALMASATRCPKITVSASELPPKRLAP